MCTSFDLVDLVNVGQRRNLSRARNALGSRKQKTFENRDVSVVSLVFFFRRATWIENVLALVAVPLELAVPVVQL